MMPQLRELPPPVMRDAFRYGYGGSAGATKTTSGHGYGYSAPRIAYGYGSYSSYGDKVSVPRPGSLIMV